MQNKNFLDDNFYCLKFNNLVAHFNQHITEYKAFLIGATYMHKMLGNPAMDVLLLVKNVDLSIKSLCLQGKMRCKFDKKLVIYQFGDIFLYIGDIKDEPELMRYVYLTEYINCNPHLKQELINIKLSDNWVGKHQFFKHHMPFAIQAEEVSRQEKLSPNIKYPLPRFGEQTVFLKNIITAANIQVGDYTYYHDDNGATSFEYTNVLYNHDPGSNLIIGKFCSIGHGVKFIMPAANHQCDGSTYPFFIFSKRWAKLYSPKFSQSRDTVIGNDVWIGRDTTIMPGVKVGDGAIIAANATVTKDVPPYTVVGGTPAKVIKQRFGDEVVQFYLKLKWWDWEIAKIEEHMDAIVNNGFDV